MAAKGEVTKTSGFGFGIILLALLLIHGVAEGMIPEHENELRSYLKLINRPSTKTIKNINGGVIDCVDIYKQRAFDHPLLRNHTIQMKPSSFPQGMKEMESNPVEMPQPWHVNGKCPEGTIPIGRMGKSDLIRMTSLTSEQKYHPHEVPRQNDNTAILGTRFSHEHAIGYLRGSKYFGTRASVNLWNPKVEGAYEFSLAQVWVLSKGTTNAVEAGWMVHPALYGDSKTRFFTFWTPDNYGQGSCYNQICPGFVHTNKDIPLNTVLNPVSTYGGQQYIIDILIFKDKKSGDWWLYLQGNQMGYWPHELLPELNDGAYMVQWGGEVVNERNGRHTKTQMGSGHFPNEGGYTKSSYFRNICIVDKDNRYRDAVGIAPVTDEPNCYGMQVGGKKGSGDWGTYFFYGGSGRSQSCP